MSPMTTSRRWWTLNRRWTPPARASSTNIRRTSSSHASFAAGDPEAAFRDADLVVANRFSTQRHTGIPMEPRACLAEYHQARQELTMWASHQTPHLLRTGLSECLGIPERRIRVISPDVGGGFGIKGNLYPDEVAVAFAAKVLGGSVLWQEDRREHFVASAHARDHVHYVEAAVTSDGVITGFRATIIVDVGAYSVWPWTSTDRAAYGLRHPARVFTAFKITPIPLTLWPPTRHRWGHIAAWHGRRHSSAWSGRSTRSPVG